MLSGPIRLLARPGRAGRRVLAALLIAAVPGAPHAAAPALQVLHWWTSASERAAVEVLVAHAAAAGVAWRDAAVDGGAGVGAGKVLRSRVLAGDAPDAAQMVGVTLAEAAGMGLLLELDGVAAADRWPQRLWPAVDAGIRFRGHVVAAPLGVHRINTLLWNRALFERLKLAPPTDWAAFERAATALAAAGIVPVAQSREAWQVGTLFESLVLAEGGPALHRALFEHRSPAAVVDPKLRAALQRLRALKAHMGTTVVDEPWTATLQRLQRGAAAMMWMGDWAKGELQRAGWAVGRDFGCAAAPGTAGQHLYSIDSLAMFARDYAHADAQQALARVALSPALQDEYNAVKGSVPVRHDADAARLDECARASWRDFARGGEALAPSLVHRMATDEPSKDAIVAEIHRFFVDDRIPATETQRRLAALYRVLPPPPAARGPAR